MAYVPVTLPAELAAFQQEVTELVDPLFSDIHAMLRLPIEGDEGLSAGCNLTCALCLLSIVEGISSRLMHSNRPVAANNDGSGDRFLACMKDHYPWDAEPQEPVDGLRALRGKTAAKRLYYAYRNPLAHALGHQHLDWLADIKVAKAPMTEAEIETLERATVRDARWRPTLGADDIDGAPMTRTVLFVPAFYWGLRQTILRTLNARLTAQAAPIRAGGQLTMSTTVYPTLTTVAPIFRKPPEAE